MKKLYEKNELTFAIVWIVIYCVLQSLANPLNEIIGIEYSASAVFCILQTIVLLGFYTKERIAEALWALQIAGSCMAVPLLCAAFGIGVGKSLERFCRKLFADRNGLPHRMHALRWISGGSDFQGAPVCFYCKG